MKQNIIHRKILQCLNEDIELSGISDDENFKIAVYDQYEDCFKEAFEKAYDKGKMDGEEFYDFNTENYKIQMCDHCDESYPFLNAYTKGYRFGYETGFVIGRNNFLVNQSLF